MQLPISVAIGDYDRTRDLLTGRVPIEGADPTYLALGPEEIFYRAFRLQEFDVCELSLSSYVLQVASSTNAYVALPVFLSRAFRHNGIYIRRGSGIAAPSDLKGRRVGCPEYQLTACVWIRGLLESQYGVCLQDIHWIRGGIEQAGRIEKLPFTLPVGVKMDDAPHGRSLTQMLVAGEIDAIVAPRRPSVYAEGHPDVAWLFADPEKEAWDYHDRFGAYPIMHVLGLRRELADRHPWLVSSLMKAFRRAKQAAGNRLEDTTAPKITLPFLEETVKRMQQKLGADFWPYGLAENSKTLEVFLDYHYRQGLSGRRLRPEELFHPASQEAFKI